MTIKTETTIVPIGNKFVVRIARVAVTFLFKLRHVLSVKFLNVDDEEDYLWSSPEHIREYCLFDTREAAQERLDIWSAVHDDIVKAKESA